MKIQTRITLIFTVLCTSFLVALSFAVYYFAYKNASQDFTTRLELRAVIAAKASLDTLQATSSAYEDIRNQHLQRLPEEKEYIINVDTLQKLAGDGFYGTIPQAFVNNLLANNKGDYRVGFLYYAGIKYTVGSNNYLVIIVARNVFVENFLLNLKTILIFACVIGLIVIFSVGLFFSMQILAPIRNISRQVKKISATSLHMRLKARKGKDEITMLNDTFNDMLNRLETAFESQNNFVSNASHELNTPLTAIIGESDFALAKPRSVEEYQRALQVIMQQGEKLQHITQSLVQLAQSGFTGNFTMQLVSVNDLLNNAINNAHLVYETCEIKTDFSLYPNNHNQPIPGNQQLLELAVSNVILNACKYSGSKPVSVAVAVSDSHVIFVIKDNGIGIPGEEVKHIFDPFFRASNTRGTIGYGIGLPLVQNIVRLHNGVIEIRSQENVGTEVVVKLPRR